MLSRACRVEKLNRYHDPLAYQQQVRFRFARFVAPIRAFIPITAGALGMSPRRFYPINIAAILLWAPAHILPGVLAVSALDRAGGVAGLEGTAKHYWMPLVIGGALIVALAVWTIRRRRGGNAIEPVKVRLQSQRRPREGGDP